jgi:hypothetical protein
MDISGQIFTSCISTLRNMNQNKILSYLKTQVKIRLTSRVNFKIHIIDFILLQQVMHT